MRLLTFEMLASLKGIVYQRDHLRRMVDEGRFPKPIRLSSARIAWIESEIDQWIEQRAMHRGKLAPRTPKQSGVTTTKRKRRRAEATAEAE